jgi:hypothetical protein
MQRACSISQGKGRGQRHEDEVGYFFVPANMKHSSSCAPGAPCVLFQEGPGKFDVKPVVEKAAAGKK